MEKLNLSQSTIRFSYFRFEKTKNETPLVFKRTENPPRISYDYRFY